MKKDDIVIYESTVYPGVTEEVCVPELEIESGMILIKISFVDIVQKELIQEIKNIRLQKILKITSGSTPQDCNSC